MTKRTEQVSALLQNIIGEVINREVEFPDGILATISRVEVPTDLKTAKVYVSILPFDRSSSTIKRLKRQVGHIQKEVNKQLTMKFFPRIEFFIDNRLEEVAKLETLMENDS